jgi:hypothetical protein
MARIGLYPALIVVVFGIVAPFFIFQIWPLDRVCASPLPGLCPRPWLRRGESGISLGCERNPRKCRLHGGKRLHPRRLCRYQLQRRRPYRQDDRVFPSRVSHIFPKRRRTRSCHSRASGNLDDRECMPAFAGMTEGRDVPLVLLECSTFGQNVIVSAGPTRSTRKQIQHGHSRASGNLDDRECPIGCPCSRT